MTTSLIVTNDSLPTWPRPADADHQLLDLWLHGRPGTTQRAYRADADRFLAYVTKSLLDVTLVDVQAFSDALEHQALQSSSRHRMLSSVKSLFAFGHRIGYLAFDIAKPLRLPALRDKLSERILSEAEVQRMLALEQHPRNHALLYLLYGSGVRVSECCGLRLRDLQARAEGGQITVQGKGARTRSILLPAPVWSVLLALSHGPSNDAPLFPSRKGGRLHPSQILRVVQAAARRAGITKMVSPHWMRHAHASHALDHGAPIHLVQSTLGHASISTTGRYLHARPTASSSQYLTL